MQWPQWIMVVWLLIWFCAHIAMANGYKIDRSSPQMSTFRAVFVPLFFWFVLTSGGFFPSPF